MDKRLRTPAGWDRLSWLTAGFSTRLGGVSHAFQGAQDSPERSVAVDLDGDLNLGFVPADDPAAVMENRRRLLAAAGAETAWQLIVSRQVHGTAIRQLTHANAAAAMLEGRGQWEADGLITRTPGLLLGAAAADCVPILIADPVHRAVGAFHAGWRGTAAGMAAQGLRAMREAFDTRPQDCLAAIGPSIGPCCYEVGEEVHQAFTAGMHDPPLLQPGARPGTWQLDLWEANRRQLLRAGLPATALTTLGECTACTREPTGRPRYFSHRAEHGLTGRMLGIIGIRA